MPDANGQPLRSDLDVKPPLLNNTAYDLLNDTVTLVFPGAVVLYTGLAAYWNWPNTEQIVGSAGLVIAFLAIIVKVASKRYQKIVNAENRTLLASGGYDGVLRVNLSDPEKDTFRLDLGELTPQDLMQKDFVAMQVELKR